MVGGGGGVKPPVVHLVGAGVGGVIDTTIASLEMQGLVTLDKTHVRQSQVEFTYSGL